MKSTAHRTSHLVGKAAPGNNLISKTCGPQFKALSADVYRLLFYLRRWILKLCNLNPASQTFQSENLAWLWSTADSKAAQRPSCRPAALLPCSREGASIRNFSKKERELFINRTKRKRETGSSYQGKLENGWEPYDKNMARCNCLCLPVAIIFCLRYWLLMPVMETECTS